MTFVTRAANCPLCLDGRAGRHPDSGGTHPAMNTQRVDITGGVLAVYPAAVVERRQFDGGINYEVKVPGRTYKVRHSVEWGDDEGEALAYILDRLAGPDTWNGR